MCWAAHLIKPNLWLIRVEFFFTQALIKPCPCLGKIGLRIRFSWTSPLSCLPGETIKAASVWWKIIRYPIWKLNKEIISKCHPSTPFNIHKIVSLKNVQVQSLAQNTQLHKKLSQQTWFGQQWPLYLSSSKWAIIQIVLPEKNITINDCSYLRYSIYPIRYGSRS